MTTDRQPDPDLAGALPTSAARTEVAVQATRGATIDATTRSITRAAARTSSAAPPYGVPYYPQWGSPAWVQAIAEDGADPCTDPDWPRSGFTDPDRYRFWSQRLCGLTCLECALDFWRIDHPPQASMLDDALRHGVYRLRDDGGVDGLIYRPFAGWVGEAFGLDVDVLPEVGLETITGAVDRETFAIVSVSPELRRPERPNAQRGGHLVLVHGRDEAGVWFHNPSGVPPWQADAHLPLATFERFYAGRGMLLRRRTARSGPT